ncbi:MAG: ABC transporter permease, partial [Myxococcota bacterium]
VGALMILMVLTPMSRPLRDDVALYNMHTAGLDARLERLALASPEGVVDADTVAALEASRATAWFPPVPRSFTKPNLDAVLAPPSRAHLLGTDSSGRDVFARMLYGTRISLTIGVLAVSLYISIGVLIGALAGYFRGWVDTVVLRVIEVMLCFPSFILILTLAAFVEQPSIFHVMLIIGLTRWTGPARLTRGEFLRLGHQDFVTAAVASGIPQHRVILRHVLPNALGPVLVNATFGIASAILVEASLAFLGLSDPSAPSWGEMLNIGRTTQSTSLILIAGLALFITLSTFNLVGEGLRDALDPKLRK